MDTVAFTTSTSKLPYYSVSVPVSIPARVPTTTCCSFSSSTSLSSSSSSSNNSSKLLFAAQTARNASILKRKSSRISCGGSIQEITETQFSDVVLKSDRPVLVEFVATWCGPCRLIAPAVQSIAEEYKEKLTVVKLDHDANPKLIEEYKIYGLPALIVFKDGKEVPGSRREGAITKVKLKEYVDAQLQSVSVA